MNMYSIKTINNLIIQITFKKSQFSNLNLTYIYVPVFIKLNNYNFLIYINSLSLFLHVNLTSIHFSTYKFHFYKLNNNICTNMHKNHELKYSMRSHEFRQCFTQTLCMQIPITSYKDYLSRLQFSMI